MVATSRRFKAVVALYVVLGLVLSAVGALTTWLSNTGSLPLTDPTYRAVALVLGLVLLLVGSHLAVAGLASLRSR